MQFCWPRQCLLCEREQPQLVAGLCGHCWVALPIRTGRGCPSCDLPLKAPVDSRRCPDCHHQPRGKMVTVAAFLYRDSIVPLHRMLKFDEELRLLDPLARRMAAAWRVRGEFRPDLVTPVPADPWRWRPRRRLPRRLARAIASQLGVPFAPLLKKRFGTRPQTGKSGEARRRGLEGAIAVLDPEQVRGRDLLLIDDVATTGGTIHAAKAALRSAGAARVGALLLARTE